MIREYVGRLSHIFAEPSTRKPARPDEYLFCPGDPRSALRVSRKCTGAGVHSTGAIRPRLGLPVRGLEVMPFETAEVHSLRVINPRYAELRRCGVPAGAGEGMNARVPASP
jgi:hypothetical protein